jgi:hypothetical protein
LGTTREWREYVGGEESEAEVRFGRDCPDKFGTGICTESVFGVGDLDMKTRLLCGRSIHIKYQTLDLGDNQTDSFGFKSSLPFESG